ncbi:hypothetical protein LguiA_010233 [Lonicera macranthoides]
MALGLTACWHDGHTHVIQQLEGELLCKGNWQHVTESTSPPEYIFDLPSYYNQTS